MKLRRLVPCLPALLLCAGSDLRAEKLYRWVDQHGKVTYQDHPPPRDAARVEEKELGDANIVPPSHLAGEGAKEERGEKRPRPPEAARAGRRTARPAETTPAETTEDGVAGNGPARDEVSGAAIAEEDAPASVISPGGDVAGSAQPGRGAGEAGGAGAASGAATAPGAVLPPLPVPVPVGP